MPLQVNLRHLDKHDLHLQGEIPPSELQLQTFDELVQVRRPLIYDLNVQLVGHSLLVRGALELTLDCSCARCLKPFDQRISLNQWTLHVPLEGEEKAEVKDDLVDLTPLIREDILLEFPQRPLCEMDCAGLAKPLQQPDETTTSTASGRISTAWSELNKLKL